MNLVTIEAPTAGVTSAREVLKFFNTPLGIVSPGELLQVVANQLVQAFPKGLRPLSGASDNLFIDRQRNIHEQSIRAHLSCVKLIAPRRLRQSLAGVDRVVDGNMLHLIKVWLEAPVEETDERGNKRRCTRNRDEGRGQSARLSGIW
jgi:hypothetical protein